VFRTDAAFAKPEISEALEERGVKYAIRIPANENLERDVAEFWWMARAIHAHSRGEPIAANAACRSANRVAAAAGSVANSLRASPARQAGTLGCGRLGL
jgi:hypothetical protein